MKTNGKATVEDEQDDEDIEAGPEMPSAEDKGPDDEEGRFFGGGITRDTADVLDFMEEQDKGASVGLASTPRTPFLLHIHLQMAALTPSLPTRESGSRACCWHFSNGFPDARVDRVLTRQLEQMRTPEAAFKVSSTWSFTLGPMWCPKN